MSKAIWLLGATALSFSGMAWLALAMDVHWGQVMHESADAAGHKRAPPLRAIGAVALLFSLLACLRADRPSMAALVWVMLLAGSAVAVTMVLSRWPQWLAPFAAGRRARKP
jgi:hypothetical protein